MKRRRFIKSTLVSGILLTLIPEIVLSRNNKLTYEELIGKGDPTLYGDGYLIRKEVYEAFQSMQADAKKSGIDIRVVSSYRNYDHQKRIWERKYKQNISNGLAPEQSIKKIIEYSTIPGTSRHHWGTDIDIVDGNFMDTPNLLSATNFEKGQPFYDLGVWLTEHSKKFDFYIVYTNEESRKGFKYEPWHFSYRPLSCEYLQQYRELDILKILKNEAFLGTDHFSEKFMNTYISENILDINPEL
ncbi:MAG: M15 family metallopeptidase, partial [Bacteroidia bacterium]|nr:M15 family metallopeptidase [Bacteroidia bacterium]